MARQAQANRAHEIPQLLPYIINSGVHVSRCVCVLERWSCNAEATATLGLDRPPGLASADGYACACTALMPSAGSVLGGGRCVPRGLAHLLGSHPCCFVSAPCLVLAAGQRGASRPLEKPEPDAPSAARRLTLGALLGAGAVSVARGQRCEQLHPAIVGPRGCLRASPLPRQRRLQPSRPPAPFLVVCALPPPIGVPHRSP